MTETAAESASYQSTEHVPASTIPDSRPKPASTILDSQPTTIPPELNAIPALEVDRDYKSEYAKLSKNFTALKDNFKKARDALQKRKDERDRWIQYAASLEKKIQTSEEEYSIKILDRNSRKMRAERHLERYEEAARPIRDASFTSDGGVDDTNTELTCMPREVAKPNKDGTLGRTTSDSTQGDTEEPAEPAEILPILPADDRQKEVKIKNEPSSDAAVFVFERSLRKRKYGDTEMETPVNRRVKAESINGSSPLLALDHFDFNPQESIDLGEISAVMSTPRKRRELEQAFIQAESQENAGPALVTIPEVSGKARGRHGRLSSVLTPINANIRILARPAAATTFEKPLSKGLDRGIAFLTEDGVVYKSGNGTPIAHGTSPAVKGRLDVLLNSPSQEEPSSLRRSAQGTRGSRLGSRDDLPIPRPRELPFERAGGKNGRRSEVSIPQTARTFEAEKTPPPGSMPPLQVKKGEKGLRDKPLEQLCLDDFKINPKANDGLDFAFTEVVRGKDDRANLDGCVSMSCCGPQWRAMALSQRPVSPLTPAQRQEEQKLLEDYLGDNSYRLTTLRKQERDEIWVEAKMRQLANKHGQHRHKYPRMRSPPGFWNADFPNTQELEADRREAKKREKETVKDRYREATRPGGRWLFRDE